MVSLGAPFDLARRFRTVALSRRRRVLAFSGASRLEEFTRIAGRFDVRKLARSVECAVLLLHGEHDERVPVSQARRLAAAIGGRARLRVAAGEDHLCSGSLAEVLLPKSLAWLRARLML